MRPRPLRVTDIADKIGVSPCTVRRWLEDGEGPAHIRTPGGMFLFPDHAAVEHWIASLAQPEPEHAA
jgi:hypothetical protein